MRSKILSYLLTCSVKIMRSRLQDISMCQSLSCVDSLRPDELYPTRILCPLIFQARTLERVAISFSAQGLNLGLLYCKWILYHLSHQGSPIFIFQCPKTKQGEKRSFLKKKKTMPNSKFRRTNQQKWLRAHSGFVTY